MKILIIDKMHESILPLLETIGLKGEYRPDITRGEILECIAEYEGIIVRSKIPIDKAFLENASHLKLVARAGAGIDNVDMSMMEQLGIELVNAPEGNRDAVAEHSMAMLLGLFNKIHSADREVRNYIWDREGNRGVELMEKTVGLLGFGYMGQAFAKRLSAFGCRVLAYDHHQVRDLGGLAYAEQVDFVQFYSEVEVLSVHIPLNKDNYGLIDATFLDQFKKLSYLLNTARGEIVVISDLLAKLDDQSLLGVALDVLPNEKMQQLTTEEKKQYDHLFQYKQVVLSPHVAGWTHESYRKINEVLVKKIEKLL